MSLSTQSKRLRIIAILLSLSFIASCSRSPEGSNQAVDYGTANLASSLINDEAGLISTGLPADVFDAITDEQRELIYATLPEGSVYLPTEHRYRTAYQPDQSKNIQVQTYGNSENSTNELLDIGIDIAVLVWQEGVRLHIYPSYESRELIQSHGKDSFSTAVSDGLSIVPNAHAASLWAKSESDSNWEALGMMQFSNISIQGYSYEGEALGQKHGKGYYKAHSYYSVDIDVPGSVPEITLGYAHDQSRGSERQYTLKASTQSLGISPGTDQVAAVLDVYRVDLGE